MRGKRCKRARLPAAPPSVTQPDGEAPGLSRSISVPGEGVRRAWRPPGCVAAGLQVTDVSLMPQQGCEVPLPAVPLRYPISEPCWRCQPCPPREQEDDAYIYRYIFMGISPLYSPQEPSLPQLQRNSNEAIAHSSAPKPRGQAVPKGFAPSQPARIPPSSEPAARRVPSSAGGWLSASSCPGGGSPYAGNGGSNYSIIPQGGD